MSQRPFRDPTAARAAVGLFDEALATLTPEEAAVFALFGILQYPLRYVAKVMGLDLRKTELAHYGALSRLHRYIAEHRASAELGERDVSVVLRRWASDVAVQLLPRCAECSAALQVDEKPKAGRPPVYCGDACKARASRKRKKNGVREQAATKKLSLPQHPAGDVASPSCWYGGLPPLSTPGWCWLERGHPGAHAALYSTKRRGVWAVWEGTGTGLPSPARWHELCGAAKGSDQCALPHSHAGAHLFGSPVEASVSEHNKEAVLAKVFREALVRRMSRQDGRAQ